MSARRWYSDWVVYGVAGSNTCPQGADRITDRDQCKKSFTDSRDSTKAWVSEGPYPDHPNGCFLTSAEEDGASFNRYVGTYLNNAQLGAGHNNSRLVCARTSPASTSALTPAPTAATKPPLGASHQPGDRRCTRCAHWDTHAHKCPRTRTCFHPSLHLNRIRHPSRPLYAPSRIRKPLRRRFLCHRIASTPCASSRWVRRVD